MVRIYLRNARREKGLTQAQLAEKIGEKLPTCGVNRATVIAWEKGSQDPYPLYIPVIRDILECGDSHLFDNVESQEETEGNDMDTTRRQINEALKTLAKFGLVSGTGVISALPIVAPETYLQQSSTTINACRTLLNSGEYEQVRDTLNAYLPTLTLMATVPSEYSQYASLLMAQAKIMQILLATFNLDYVKRESLCSEAVRFAQQSGNTRLLVTAMTWQGDTFKYCYRIPEKAIPIFTKALLLVGSDARLNRSSLLINLSVAYAQDSKKDESLEFARQAQKIMPEHPELDPFYQYIRKGQAELDQLEGKAYLFLSEKFPEYAELAYNLFEKSTNNQAHSQGYRSQALIYKAEAAIIVDSLPKFVEHLTESLAMGIRSKGKLNDLQEALSHVPESWQKETPVLKLQRELLQVGAM